MGIPCVESTLATEWDLKIAINKMSLDFSYVYKIAPWLWIY